MEAKLEDSDDERDVVKGVLEGCDGEVEDKEGVRRVLEEGEVTVVEGASTDTGLVEAVLMELMPALMDTAAAYCNIHIQC